MRILLAALAGLIFLAAYLAAVLALADRVQSLHWAVQGGFFLLAGVAWAWPIRWLMFWAARKPR